MHLADSVRQKAMRIFTRLTRRIDIRFGFNFGRVPPPLHDGTLITFGRSFFPFFRVTSASVRNVGRAGVVVSQNEKKEERLSLSPSDSWVLLPPLCAQDGAETVDHISLGRVSPARGASPASSHAQSSTSSMLPIGRLPFPSDLSRSGKV